MSTLRASKSQENYRQIGGAPFTQDYGSTGHSTATTSRGNGREVSVYIGMRYWNPFTEEAIERIKRDHIKKLVILPLYPQFSISTSGSSFRVLEEMWQQDPYLRLTEYTLIPSWYDHPAYLSAMADLIARELEQCPNPDQVHIFFSAMVSPKLCGGSGDPYQRQLKNALGRSCVRSTGPISTL
nr:ferrochelatase [Microcystis panniformis]